jgi:hypothetical protein
MAERFRFRMKCPTVYYLKHRKMHCKIFIPGNPDVRHWRPPGSIPAAFTANLSHTTEGQQQHLRLLGVLDSLLEVLGGKRRIFTELPTDRFFI